jgi:hypothetical protein
MGKAEVSLMGSGQVSTGVLSSFGSCSWLSQDGLFTWLGSPIEGHRGLGDLREMGLGDFGVEDGAAAEEEMIPMTLHHLIQVTHVGSLQQVERHPVSDKRAGDLGSGQGHWEVRPLGTWLAIEEADSKRCLRQDRAGLVVITAMDGEPVLAHDLVRGRVRAPVLPPGTKARDLARHLDDE